MESMLEPGAGGCIKKPGTIVAQVLYLFLPLLCSAALSGIVLRANFWAWLKRPIDGGVVFRGSRLFGDNKTWRGLACTIIGCTVTVAVQKYVVGERADAIAVVDYDEVNALALGTTLGTGAVLGELPNSFVKRQLGIPPGKRTGGVLGAIFYIWDQVDLLLAIWPLLLFWIRPSRSLLLSSFALVFAMHQLVSLVGYLIGARESLS